MRYGRDIDVKQHEWQCRTCRLAARARDGFLLMPNNPLVVTALQAICAGGPRAMTIDGGWRRNKAGEPRYEFWNGAGARIVVRVAARDADAAWRDVLGFSSLTLDVATVLLCALASEPFRQSTCAPRRESVTLGASVVLNAKGYRRYGAERDAFAGAIAEEFERIERLRFDIIDYPAFDPQARKWNSAGVRRSDVALVESVWDGEASPANDVDDCVHSRPLRFGAWADYWLNSGGVVWLTLLPDAIVKLDHRENRSADALAKRIATLLTLTLGAARKAENVRLSTRQLLRRVGVLSREARPAHSGRVADRLEEALLRLSERGLLRADLNAEASLMLRAESKQWFEHWLDAEVVFARPAMGAIAG